MLARRAIGLRRHVRPNAFGNVLGDSLVDAMQPRDELGDFINEKLAEQAKRDMYGLATAPNASRVRFGDGCGGITPAQQRGLEAGLGPRTAENSRAISDYASWLVENTDLSMSLQPRNAGAGR